MLINVVIREAAPYAMAVSQQNGTCPVVHADLPQSCSPRACRVGFERAGGTSRVLVDKNVVYRGESDVFRSFLSEGVFAYHDDSELEGFLGELDAAVGRPDARRSPPRPGGGASVTAFDEEAFVAKMSREVVGQDRVIDVLSNLLAGSVRKTNPSRPLALVFAGETGVGKTLTARCMAEALTEATGVEYGLLRIDMNQLGERHQESRLYGAPPGYVGYDDPPLLEPVRGNPRQVILFDEMEKADPGVMLTLMNAMSEGRMESAGKQGGGGSVYDLSRCVMVFTTNCRFDVDDGLPQQDVTDECRRQMGGMFRTLRFPPEVIGRFSEILLFAGIGEEGRRSIAELSIRRLGREYSLEVESVDQGLLDSLCLLCSAEGGVRSIEYMAERVLGKAFANYFAAEGPGSVAVRGSARWPMVASWGAPPG